LEPRSSINPYAQSITYFARALGAMNTCNLDRARQDVAHIGEQAASYESKPDQKYWQSQTELLLQAASGWLSLKQGDKPKALQAMRAAADTDDAIEKSVAMENRLVPMRELLAYMLLEAGQPQEALVEFQASLKSRPNRFRGYYGAAKAAEAEGNLAAARNWYERLLVLATDARSARPEIVEARAAVAAGQEKK
jgi:tetratricopeptide (TPR) repeat protein